MVDISKWAGAATTAGATVWAWIGDNVGPITAACAIGGLIVQIVATVIKSRRA